MGVRRCRRAAAALPALAAAAIGIPLLAPSLYGEADAGDPDPLPFHRGWTGRLEAGQTLQSGRTDRDEITLRAEAEREAGRIHHRAIGEYVYGKQNGSKTSDRYGASYRWRYDLNDSFYAQSLTSFEADRIRRIEERAEQNLSLGYRLLDTDRLESSVAPGATAQYNREAGVETEMNYLATVSQDFSWQITDAHHFREDSTFLVNPEESEDISYRFNASLTGDITRGFDLSIRYRFLYENQVAAGVERAEHRVITSLGYSF